jgi:hypothetical protein
MIKEFKFLTPAKPPITGRYWGGTNTQGIRFNNGNTITRHSETLTANHNRLQYDNPIIVIHSFRWVENFNHRLILGENYRTNSEVYEGTIDRFMETYRNRSEIIRHATLPPVPVIERIQCGGACFYRDTLRFSHGNMWVKIVYKKFYERV